MRRIVSKFLNFRGLFYIDKESQIDFSTVFLDHLYEEELTSLLPFFSSKPFHRKRN